MGDRLVDGHQGQTLKDFSHDWSTRRKREAATGRIREMQMLLASANIKVYSSIVGYIVQWTIAFPLETERAFTNQHPIPIQCEQMRTGCISQQSLGKTINYQQHVSKDPGSFSNQLCLRKWSHAGGVSSCSPSSGHEGTEASAFVTETLLHTGWPDFLTSLSCKGSWWVYKGQFFEL